MSSFTFARILAVLILSTLSAFIAGTLFAAQVTLTWDAVTGQSISGYKIYYGTASRNYTTSVDAKNVTSFPVTGLQDGTTYYFAATVYNEAKAESGFSNEVTYTTTPGTTTPPPQTCTYSLSSSNVSFGASGGGGNVNITAPGGCEWGSSGAPAWITVTAGSTGAGNGTFIYSVAANTTTSSRSATLTIAGKQYTVIQAGVSTSNYTITATKGTGGSISPLGSATVAYGGSKIFTIAPYSGYVIADVKVDGVSVGAVTYYMFSNVTANHTIDASFASSASYTLAISKTGTGTGTVTNSPSGTTFAQGTSVTLTATPDASSTFTGWSGACSGTTTCTVTMNANASVTATFTAKSTTYTITATKGTGGSISPLGSATVAYGGSKIFTIAPYSGYVIADVKVDGVSVGAVTYYMFSNVTANHTIDASFASSASYTLAISKTGTGTGTVTNSPSGTTFAQGTSVTLTATPDASSTFTGWSGACSGTTTCTVTMNANASVTATFTAKSTTYTITATKGTGGSISPLGSATVAYGGSKIFTIAPYSGYVIADVKVDGVSVGAVTYYMFSNVTANHTIDASFSP